MDTLHKELLTIKQSVTDAHAKLASLKGSKKEVISYMKKEFGVATLKEAKALRLKMRTKINKMDKTLGEKVNDLSERHADALAE